MNRIALYATLLSVAGLSAPAFAQNDSDQQSSQDRQSQRYGDQGQRHQQQQRQSRQGQRSHQQMDQRSQQSRRQSRQGQQQQEKEVSGRLSDYRTIQLDNQREKHVLAKVELDNGRTVILDLGPVSGLRDQDRRLSQGQTMRASGRAGRINDMPVLIVDRFLHDNQFTILAFRRDRAQSRQGQQRSGMQGRQDMQRMAYQQDRPRQMQGRQRQDRPRSWSGRQHIEGRITSMRDVDLQGVPDSHRLVKLRTRDGRTVIADLGTTEEFQSIDLQEGDQVMVRGNTGRINHEPVIFAREVAEVVRIDREDQADRASRDSQQRQQQRNQGQNRY